MFLCCFLSSYLPHMYESFEPWHLRDDYKVKKVHAHSPLLSFFTPNRWWEKPRIKGFPGFEPKVSITYSIRCLDHKVRIVDEQAVLLLGKRHLEHLHPKGDRRLWEKLKSAHYYQLLFKSKPHKPPVFIIFPYASEYVGLQSHQVPGLV